MIVDTLQITAFSVGSRTIGKKTSFEMSMLTGCPVPGAEMRYRKLYEDRMDPFKEFHQREQEQSYRSLRLHDKVSGIPYGMLERWKRLLGNVADAELPWYWKQ
jgi:hypothetical protein